jgi:hypothetical protein
LKSEAIRKLKCKSWTTTSFAQLQFWRSKRAIGLLVQKTQLLLKKDHRVSTVVKKKKKVQSLRERETRSICSKEGTLFKISLMASSQICATGL